MRALWLFGTAIPVLSLATVLLIPMPTKLIYNGSKSAPIGFYWVDQQPIDRDDYVLLKMPEHVRKLVEKRHYLPAEIPLIKRAVGIDGDMICRRDREIVVNGVTVAVARMRDKRGRPLPDWQGCRRLMANEVFLLQDHHLSFDSRYFGPVKHSLIIGKAVKLRLPWRKYTED